MSILERFDPLRQPVSYAVQQGELWVTTPYVSLIADARALWPFSPCCREGIYEGPWDRSTDDGQAYCEKCEEPLGLRDCESRWPWDHDWKSEVEALLSYSLDPLTSVLVAAPLLEALAQLQTDFATHGEECWGWWLEDDGRKLTYLAPRPVNALGQAIT